VDALPGASASGSRCRRLSDVPEARAAASSPATGAARTRPSAEVALRPNLRTVSEKSRDQLDLQALHRVRSRLVSRRTATVNQIRAFVIEQGNTIRKGPRAVRNSLLSLLDERRDEISPRVRHIILGLLDDWMRLDERI
jgi:transposase